MKRRDAGIRGERLARDFLKRRGYQIWETNYRCPEGEMDIIAKEGESLVFIEVRTKTSAEFGTPEESITPSKMRRLAAITAYYYQNHNDLPPSCRIDVVAVELSKEGKLSRIELIKNAVGDI